VEGLGQDIITQAPLKKSAATAEGISTAQQAYVEGEILVKFDSTSSLEQIQSFYNSQGMTVLEMNKALDIYRLKISETVIAAVASARAQPFVTHARPNYILAEVNDEIITLLDMEILIDQINPFLRQVYTREAATRSLLQSMVDYKLFAKAAMERNLDEIPEVKRKLEAAKDKALAQVYQEKIITDTIVTSEEEVKNYYSKHLKEFQRPEQIRVQHILVDTEKEAEEIINLLDSGADFEMLAKERSKDLSSQFGGPLGWFERGRMDPAFEKAAFGLSKGEVSRIVKSKSGYHILKVVDRKAPRPKSLSEARAEIEQTLRLRKQTEIIAAERKELIQKYKTRLYIKSLSEVKVQKAEAKDQRDLIQNLQEMLKKPY
jgi:peptidyl-prolyl cis-trans isomerase C